MRTSRPLVWAQLAVGSIGLLLSLSPLIQAMWLSQVPLIGVFVGVGPGVLLSLTGFAIVVFAGWLGRE